MPFMEENDILHMYLKDMEDFMHVGHYPSPTRINYPCTASTVCNKTIIFIFCKEWIKFCRVYPKTPSKNI